MMLFLIKVISQVGASFVMNEIGSNHSEFLPNILSDYLFVKNV